MKKGVKIFLIVSSAVVLLAGALFGGLYLYSENYSLNIPKKVNLEKQTKTLTAIGRGIYDTNGEQVVLNGINYGNWLLQEEWMSVNSIGPVIDENGNYISDSGVVNTYKEMSQSDLDQALKNNPNLTDTQIEELWDIYYSSYCQEQDFKNIKDVGFNMIRLPVYYRTFLEGDDNNLVMKEDAFEYVDYFLEMCKKYELYCIIDMHGVPGGQNGLEHSGTFENTFFTTEKYVEVICNLWKDIASHYKNERNDLYSTIAAYDILNEPTGENHKTGKEEWGVFDKIYDAIRSVDTDHIISIESCWSYYGFANPKTMGWENVLYQLHMYNWNNSAVSYELFFMYNNFYRIFNDYDVPLYIGEFTFFDNAKVYDKYLNYWTKNGISWSIWSYKVCSNGWWDSSWGLYVHKLWLYDLKLKLDCSTATYDEIKTAWEKESTENYEKGFLYETMTNYFNQKN